MSLLKNAIMSATAIFFAFAPSAASAVTVTFRFSTDLALLPNGQTAPVPGTVIGKIFGLIDNSTGPATSIVIEDFLAEAGYSAPIFFNYPADAVGWKDQFYNSFTLVNGVVTDGNFWAQDLINGNALYINKFIGFSNNTNFASVGIYSQAIWNNNGMSENGIVFGSSVPEPATWSALIAGLALVGSAMRRRRSVLPIGVPAKL